MLPQGDEQDRSAQLRQVCAELERRLRAGAGRAEDLLRECPQVAANPDAALELIYTEFVLRQEMGQQPSVAEWYSRFPTRRGDLAQLFQVHHLARAGLVDTSPGGLASPTPLAECAGRRLGQYELVEEVGRGGMGVVYKARQEGLNRPVALKLVLGGEHAGELELARFRREAEVVARLQHPNIVQIFEVGAHDGLPYFSMEFIPGSLVRRLAGGPLVPRQAAALLEKLARAVQAAHEAGIVHRDLKPANVLLAGEAEAPVEHCVPKVVDFGLAKWLQEAGASGRGWRTETGAIVGTPSYMAPEQAEGRGKDVGPQADVWALGAVLYECLTGRPPFLAAGALETLLQVRSEEPVSPRLLNAQVPRDLETICLKCLRKEPVRRFHSAVELAEDLRRWQAGEPIVARPVSAPERAVKWARRRPTVVGLLAAIVVGVVAAFWALRNEQAKTAQQRDEARENLEEAIAAVDECFGLAKDDPLLQDEDMRKVRKLLLEKTLPFYRGFVRRSSDDPELWARQAEYLYRVGYITLEIGSTAEALQSYEQARDILRRLSEVHPDVTEYQASLADTWDSLGIVQMRLGKTHEALKSYSQSGEIYRKLSGSSPEVVSYQDGLARAWHSLVPCQPWIDG